MTPPIGKCCEVCQCSHPTPQPGWIMIDWSYVDADGKAQEGFTEYCGTDCLLRDWARDGCIGQEVPDPGRVVKGEPG